MHLEADAKVLATSLKCLACFIQKRPLKGRPIEQFPSVLEIGSYVWRLLQAVSEAGLDRFKISPQPDAPTLVEAMRTVYGPVPVPVPTPSPDVEMAVDTPECQDHRRWTLFYFSFFIFILLFFSFSFHFLFLEQLELGVISHAVTSVTT